MVPQRIYTWRRQFAKRAEVPGDDWAKQRV
ncbi:hypothetical protein CCGE531_30180 (plasmid) [Rhizobium sp. CCGE531]|nr:hypothetical protein CCGE531_30180 [Rhizobium sp. CCGE531]TGE88803.1 hypothetical protein C9417_30785 [Rhizobium sp. SEMIA 4088]